MNCVRGRIIRTFFYHENVFEMLPCNVYRGSKPDNIYMTTGKGNKNTVLLLSHDFLVKHTASAPHYQRM